MAVSDERVHSDPIFPEDIDDLYNKSGSKHDSIIEKYIRLAHTFSSPVKSSVISERSKNSVRKSSRKPGRQRNEGRRTTYSKGDAHSTLLSLFDEQAELVEEVQNSLNKRKQELGLPEDYEAIEIDDPDSVIDLSKDSDICTEPKQSKETLCRSRSSSRRQARQSLSFKSSKRIRQNTALNRLKKNTLTKKNNHAENDSRIKTPSRDRKLYSKTLKLGKKVENQDNSVTSQNSEYLENLLPRESCNPVVVCTMPLDTLIIPPYTADKRSDIISVLSANVCRNPCFCIFIQPSKEKSNVESSPRGKQNRSNVEEGILMAVESFLTEGDSGFETALSKSEMKERQADLVSRSNTRICPQQDGKQKGIEKNAKELPDNEKQSTIVETVQNNGPVPTCHSTKQRKETLVLENTPEGQCVKGTTIETRMEELEAKGSPTADNIQGIVQGTDSHQIRALKSTGPLDKAILDKDTVQQDCIGINTEEDILSCINTASKKRQSVMPESGNPVYKKRKITDDNLAETKKRQIHYLSEKQGPSTALKETPTEEAARTELLTYGDKTTRQLGQNHKNMKQMEEEKPHTHLNVDHDSSWDKDSHKELNLLPEEQNASVGSHHTSLNLLHRKLFHKLVQKKAQTPKTIDVSQRKSCSVKPNGEDSQVTRSTVTSLWSLSSDEGEEESQSAQAKRTHTTPSSSWSIPGLSAGASSSSQFFALNENESSRKSSKIYSLSRKCSGKKWLEALEELKQRKQLRLSASEKNNNRRNCSTSASRKSTKTISEKILSSRWLNDSVISVNSSHQDRLSELSESGTLARAFSSTAKIDASNKPQFSVHGKKVTKLSSAEATSSLKERILLKSQTTPQQPSVSSLSSSMNKSIHNHKRETSWSMPSQTPLDGSSYLLPKKMSSKAFLLMLRERKKNLMKSRFSASENKNSRRNCSTSASRKFAHM